MTSTDLFTFRDQQVRAVVIEGEPHFLASDVTAILGYSHSPSAIRRLDQDEYAQVAYDQVFATVRPSHGQPPRQPVTVVNEPGLYSLILWSQKPEAKAFKRWVTHEVLPAIRRTGQFGSQIPGTFAEALELAADQVRRVEALEAKAAEDAPKVEAYDALMDADGFYTMEAAAKALGMGRTTFFRRLREEGIIQAGSRLPYQRHMHHFKVTTSTWTDAKGQIHPTQTPRVRPSGLDFLRRRLASETEVPS